MTHRQHQETSKFSSHQKEPSPFWGKLPATDPPTTTARSSRPPIDEPSRQNIETSKSIQLKSHDSTTNPVILSIHLTPSRNQTGCLVLRHTHIPLQNLTITSYFPKYDRSLLKYDFPSKDGRRFPRITFELNSDLVLKVETDVPSLLQVNSESRAIAGKRYRLRRIAVNRNYNAPCLFWIDAERDRVEL